MRKKAGVDLSFHTLTFVGGEVEDVPVQDQLDRSLPGGEDENGSGKSSDSEEGNLPPLNVNHKSSTIKITPSIDANVALHANTALRGRSQNGQRRFPHCPRIDEL